MSGMGGTWTGCESHKSSFTSRAKAMKALRHTRMAAREAKRVYLCPKCGGWHMTKAEQRPKP